MLLTENHGMVVFMRVVNTVNEQISDNHVVENLQFYDCYDDGHYLYFSAQERNGLFRFEKKNEKTEFLAWFEQELKEQQNMHRKVIFANNKLFFLPHYGHCIHSVDLDTLEQRSIVIAEKRDGVVHYSNAFLIDDCIWIIPSFLCENPVVKINIFNERIEKDYVLQNYVTSKNLIGGDRLVDIYGSDLWGEQLILSLLGTNVLIFLNTRNNNLSVKTIPLDIYSRSILVDSDCVWLTLVDSYDVIEYNLCTDKVEVFAGKEFDGIYYPFVGIVKVKEQLLALAGYGDECFIINEKEKALLKIEGMYPEDLVRITKDYALFTGIISGGSETLLLPRGTNRMLSIDESGKCIRSVRLYCDDIDNTVECLNSILKQGCLCENLFADLHHYLYLLMADKAI